MLYNTGNISPVQDSLRSGREALREKVYQHCLDGREDDVYGRRPLTSEAGLISSGTTQSGVQTMTQCRVGCGMTDE